MQSENENMKTLLVALLIGLSNIHARAEELTLFVRAPEKSVDWSTPATLARSALQHTFSFRDSFLGSAWVELTCGPKRTLAGVRPLSTSFLSALLIHGQGLSVIAQNFQGTFETPDNLEKKRLQHNVRFLALKLSPLQCQRALRYLSEFQANKVERNYSLGVKPRTADGASAASFAVSFLEILNLLDQEMIEAWTRTIHVPVTLAGPPLKDQKIGVYRLLNNLGSWAREGEKSIPVKFIDSELIHKWIGQKLVRSKAPMLPGTEVTPQGIILKRDHFPTPSDPLWRQQIDPSDKRKTALLPRPTRPPKKSRSSTGEEQVFPN